MRHECKTGSGATARLPVFSVPSMNVASGLQTRPRPSGLKSRRYAKVKLLEIDPDADAGLRATDVLLVGARIQLHRRAGVAKETADGIAIGEVVVHADRHVDAHPGGRLARGVDDHVLCAGGNAERTDAVLAE